MGPTDLYVFKAPCRIVTRRQAGHCADEETEAKRNERPSRGRRHARPARPGRPASRGLLVCLGRSPVSLHTASSGQAQGFPLPFAKDPPRLRAATVGRAHLWLPLTTKDSRPWALVCDSLGSLPQPRPSPKRWKSRQGAPVGTRHRLHESHLLWEESFFRFLVYRRSFPSTQPSLHDECGQASGNPSSPGPACDSPGTGPPALLAGSVSSKNKVHSRSRLPLPTLHPGRPGRFPLV